jgi:hypothetical protein
MIARTVEDLRHGTPSMDMHAMPEAIGKSAAAIVIGPEPHAPRDAMDTGMTTDPTRC